MFAVKLARISAHIKTLKGIATTTQKGLKFTSQTDDCTFEITNPQQVFLASLVACENATVKALTKTGKFKVNKIDFKKVESTYSLEKFMKGGKDNHINDVFIEAQFQTNGTQQDLDELHKKVQNHCPVYCAFVGAGIKINSKWTNVNKSQ